MFTFRYELDEWGWATAWVGNGQSEAEIRVSYLSDPIIDFAKLACYLGDDDRDSGTYPDDLNVSFDSEGEIYELAIVKPSLEIPEDDGPLLPFNMDADLEFEFRKLGGHDKQATSEVLFSGSCTVRQFCERVMMVLLSVLEANGFLGYRAKWLNTDFPLTWYARLCGQLGVPSLQIKL